MRHGLSILAVLIALNLSMAGALKAQPTTAEPAETEAQQPAAPSQVGRAEVDDEHREVANEFFALMDVKETFMAGFMVGVEPYLEQMKQSGLPADKQLKIRQAFIRYGQTVANDPELTRRLVDVYVQLFSRDELTRLVEFYSTPAGRKFLKLMPALTQQSAVVGEQIGVKHQAQLQKEVDAILKEEPQAPASSPAP